MAGSYRAASLVNYALTEIPKFIIDKTIPYTSSNYNLTAIAKPVTTGVQELIRALEKLK